MRSGFSLVELLVVMVILAITLGEVTRSLINVAHLEPVQRESALALNAARSKLEEMRARPFEELVARYDADPANDPDGPGTAPGSGFAVRGLDLRDGDPDGWQGAVLLPLVGGELREDVADAALGLPRDLNADDVVDGLDHAGDFSVLPVRVRVEWSGGAAGERSVELVTTLVPDR